MTDVGLFARMDGEWIGEDWEHQLGFRGALSGSSNLQHSSRSFLALLACVLDKVTLPVPAPRLVSSVSS